MNFINSITTANFVITIATVDYNTVNVSFKATTDDAKVFIKAKKIKKTDALSMAPGDVMAKIETLENGVSALTAILKA